MEYLICECGCGTEITRKPRPGRLNKFIHGHHRKGIVMTNDQKEKIGVANSGRKQSKRQRKLMSNSKKKGYREGTIIHWSKTDKAEEVSKKIADKRRGVSFIKTIKNGRFKTNKGYIMVFVRSHPINGTGYMGEHRLVMEKHIGRELETTEDVHHLDGDKTNNSLDNLMLFPTRSAHIKFHNRH